MRSRAPLFLAAGIAASAGFAAVACAVARRRTVAVDREVHEQTAVEQGHPARDAAQAIGKWWSSVPAGVLTSAYVALSSERRGPSRVAGMAAIVGAATAATALADLFDELLPQPPPPPGRPPAHPVFPSGHAFGTASVALTAAYVLVRERAAHPAVVIPIATAVPLVSSMARLMEEKHWISDVIGGHLAAVALAFFALAAYEAAAHGHGS